MECTQLVDLIFFMGQSNMAGRGDAALAPAVTPGMGFEYRAVTDPAQLHPLAKGGSSITEWLPGMPFFEDAVRRARKARKFLAESGYTIRHSAMVWCQGCTDGDLHTLKAVYKLDTDRVIHEFMTDAGLETCFLIQIGNQRDEPELYVPIQQAQEELAAACDDIAMVSRSFKTFAAKGLMKDRFHYLQPAYNEVGEEAGRSVAEYWAEK